MTFVEGDKVIDNEAPNYGVGIVWKIAGHFIGLWVKYPEPVSSVIYNEEEMKQLSKYELPSDPEWADVWEKGSI